MAIGRVNFPGKGPMRGQFVFIWSESCLFFSVVIQLLFFFSVIISGDSVSYLHEMVVLISLDGTLTQTRIGTGRVTFPSKRTMTGQYGVLIAKFQIFIRFIFAIVISGDSAFYYNEKITLISLECTLTQTRIEGR